MSYTVLARKYRPQRFDEIVGQQHVTRTIKNAIRMDRVHHAFLFTGVRGVGKTTGARILAKALCCREAPTEEPCNVCDSCVAITQGTSPDVFEIDGASNTGVDDVRELQEGIHYTPSQGRYRVYIIDEVHMLTQNAFNALLKTLEEPPPHVKFIFATTEPHKLPATILSRVQRYDYRRLSVPDLMGHLGNVLGQEHIDLPPAALNLIAREAGGSVRDGMSLLDQVLAFGGEQITEEDVRRVLGVVDRSMLNELSNALIDGDAAVALTTFKTMSEYGYDLRHFVTELAEQTRNMVIAASVKDPATVLDITEDEAAVLQKLAMRAGKDQLMRMFNIISQTVDGVLRSPFPHLMLEVLLVRMCEVRPVTALQDLVDQLGALQRTGGMRPAAGPAPQPMQRPAPQPQSRPAPRPQPQQAPKQAAAPGPAATRTAPSPAENNLLKDAPKAKDWPSFVSYLMMHNQKLWGYVYQAVNKAFSPAGVVITYTPDRQNTFDLITAEDKEAITAVIRKFFGDETTSVRFEMAGNSTPAPPAPEPQKPSASSPAPAPKPEAAADASASVPGKSMLELDIEKKQAHKKQVEEDIMGHPSMDMLKDKFGEDIKVDIRHKDGKKDRR